MKPQRTKRKCIFKKAVAIEIKEKKLITGGNYEENEGYKNKQKQ